MTQKTSQLIMKLLAVCAAVVVLTCGIFLFRGQQRLLDLVNHRSQRVTEVYSGWLDLVPDSTVTLEYIKDMLVALGYENISGPLQKAGQYREDFSHLELWTRGFQYPDEILPSQRLRLSFSAHRLDKMETLPDEHTVPIWRLEPKRFAQWSTKAGATQP